MYINRVNSFSLSIRVQKFLKVPVISLIYNHNVANMWFKYRNHLDFLNLAILFEFSNEIGEQQSELRRSCCRLWQSG